MQTYFTTIVAKSFLKVLPELIDAGLITTAAGEEIKQYFKNKPDKSQGRLVIIFSILGALLIGLGIILIIAHNWDEFSRPIKTVFAFLPLITGQIICAYVILKKTTRIGWREGSATFLFCAVGASISLVSQIYNIPGNLSSFLFTWMILCLPTVYLLRSTITSYFVLIGITFYACETSYWSRHNEPSWAYWLIIALLIPHYIHLYRANAKSNFFIILNWLIPLSITICLGTLADSSEDFMFIAYSSWFAICILLGNRIFTSHNNVISNPLITIGSAGTIVMLLMLSFDWFWDELRQHELSLLSIEFGVASIISLAASALLIHKLSGTSKGKIEINEIIYLWIILIFIIGLFSSQSAIVLINLLVLTLGILIVIKGARQSHLGILNYGLLIITALILCRFFDTDISFIARGIMFVLVGAGFFAGNYLMLKKRKSDEA